MKIPKLSQKAWIWIGIIAFILIIIAMFGKDISSAIKNLGKNKGDENTPKDNSKPIPGNVGASPKSTIFKNLPDGSIPIKYGDKNKAVYIFQYCMNYLYNAGLIVDGDFGNKTKAVAIAHYSSSIIDKRIANIIYQEMIDKRNNSSVNTDFINVLAGKLGIS
ncbi:MAG: hypothetical protein WC343_04805 [Bacilli bacterium]|jgi:hypothetical protein